MIKAGLEHPWLKRDELEQRIIEHMTFEGKYLCSQRLIDFVDEQIPEDMVFDEEEYDQALKKAEQIIIDLDYKKVKRGYVRDVKK